MPQQQLHTVVPWGEPAAVAAGTAGGEPAGAAAGAEGGAAGDGDGGGGAEDVGFFSGPLLAAQLGVALGRRWEDGRQGGGCLSHAVRQAGQESLLWVHGHRRQCVARRSKQVPGGRSVVEAAAAGAALLEWMHGVCEVVRTVNWCVQSPTPAGYLPAVPGLALRTGSQTLIIAAPFADGAIHAARERDPPAPAALLLPILRFGLEGRLDCYCSEGLRLVQWLGPIEAEQVGLRTTHGYASAFWPQLVMTCAHP